MTSSELYAQKRIEAESLIRAHAPERLQDALIDFLRPAIALTATRFVDEAIPVGASKFGGAPDVPAGFVWPTWNEKPLGFLAHMNFIKGNSGSECSAQRGRFLAHVNFIKGTWLYLLAPTHRNLMSVAAPIPKALCQFGITPMRFFFFASPPYAPTSCVSSEKNQ